MKSVTLTEGATLTLDFGQNPGGQTVTLEWQGARSQLAVVLVPGHMAREELRATLEDKPVRTDVKVQKVPAGQKPVFESVQEGRWTAMVVDEKRNTGVAWFTVTKGQDALLTVTPSASP